jgi:hypothetical protein
MTQENFQQLPSSLLISLAKLGFNSVSYGKMVSEKRDVCLCQAQKKLSIKRQYSARSLVAPQ